MKVWHFLKDDGTTDEGRIKVTVGEMMKVSGEILPCHRGLHGSVRAIDALRYAPGAMVQRAELGGTIVPHGDPTDKHAASERTCLAVADATETLRYFSRWCALSVIDKWDAPQVVLDYLMIGDEELRDAATYAARDAARDAATYAARDAAWAAARDAAWAATYAAWDAAGAAQNTELERLLNELMEGKP